MVGSRLLSPLGKHIVPALRRPSILGRGDGAAPDAEAFLIGNTPGPLGRGDWADPDHPACECRLKPSPGPSILSLMDAEHDHAAPHLPAPRVPKHKGKIKLPPGTEGKFEDPPWLKVACAEEAKHIVEEHGLDKNNPRILEYLATAPGLQQMPFKVFSKKLKKRVPTGSMMGNVDETPWCGCFVMWCLREVHIKARGLAMAKDWLNAKKFTEEPIDKPRVGAIAVVFHEATEAVKNTTSSGFHVAFYLGGSPKEPVLLGGNQDNSVCRKPFGGGWTVKGYRWPAAAATPGK